MDEFMAISEEVHRLAAQLAGLHQEVEARREACRNLHRVRHNARYVAEYNEAVQRLVACNEDIDAVTVQYNFMLGVLSNLTWGAPAG